MPEFDGKTPKILVITNNPLRASFRLRIKEYLPYLEDAGIYTDVHKLPESTISRYFLFQSAKNYNAVLLHKKCLNRFDATVLRLFSSKIIYDFDDAVMCSPSRPQAANTRHFKLFRRTAKMADVVIAGNEYLAGHARRFCRNVYILPTGLDIKAFEKVKTYNNDNKIRLVWIGSRITLRYLEGIKDVLEDTGKQNPNVVLRIIADEFFDLNNMAVEKKTWSLNSEAEDLMQCDIGLAPLPDDRYTQGKCGFKILQYFAAGLPAIASPVGVNVDFIRNSRAGALAQTKQQWRDEIANMIQNASLRSQLGQNARRFAEQFDLAVLARQFCSIIKSNI